MKMGNNQSNDQGDDQCTDEEPLKEINITVNSKKVVKESVIPNMVAANLCWITDSDIHRNRTVSMEEALRDLGPGSLRFPYGHLADNYLWHSPPFDDTDGLQPRPATTSTAPGNWKWALKEDGTFKDDMDFDEYMSMSSKLGVKPLVVVNAISWKYKGGPSYQKLKKSAIEWVKYSKANNYKVAYWQIGNEVDHHQNILKREEYVKLYFDFAAAMKEVDPSIQVGPGILGNKSYYNDILAGDLNLVDFLSVHQYLFGQPGLSSYKGYRNFSGCMINNIQKATGANKTANTWKPILVTETNSFGTALPKGPTNINAMLWFELALTIQSQSMVRYLYFWGSHSPWGGNPMEQGEDAATLFDDSNYLTPRGKVCQALNRHMLSKLVHTTSSAPFIKVWASTNKPPSEVVVFIVNRDKQAHRATIDMGNFSPASVLRTWRYKGDKPLNAEYSIDTIAATISNSGDVQLALPKLSISIIHLSN